MKNLTYIITFLLLFSCAHQKKSISHKEILTYCQDLNVLHTRINLIQTNLANKNTTRTAEGGPYQRKFVKSCKLGICEIGIDVTPPILKYEPKHPDADKNGYVAYPYINEAAEAADQLFWDRVYTNINGAFQLPNYFFLKDKRAKECFEKFPNVKENYDYSEYLGRETNIY